MAKYEYKGDGTVEIAGLGTLSPGDVISAPDSFGLKERDDFKGGSGEVVRTVEEPVVQPNQDADPTPADEPASSGQSAPAPVTKTDTTASTTTPQGA